VSDYHGFDWPGGPEYEPPPPPRCQHCGAFLRCDPDSREPWEDALDCDGSETGYDEPYGEGLIAVLGEEVRGKTYRVMYSPCGSNGGQHQPHREVIAAGEAFIWTCRRCGKETRDQG
jgi:hypothetical protein